MYQPNKISTRRASFFTQNQRAYKKRHWVTRATCLAAALLCMVSTMRNAAAEAPLLRNPAAQIDKPDLSGLTRLRFLTTLDFPPFNFADATKKPTGFNVELARAICSELDIEAKCEVQALPWGELEPALENGRGEAIIAGTAVTAQKRARFAMTPSYFRFPARFVGLNNGGEPALSDISDDFAGKRVAVVEGSAHAAMLETYFPDAIPVSVADEIAAHNALRAATTTYIFGDGVSLGFFLASGAAKDCCNFVGGPYFDARFLGEGMGIVMRKPDRLLLEAIEAALIETKRNGTYFDIVARYFPRSPFDG